MSEILHYWLVSKTSSPTGSPQLFYFLCHSVIHSQLDAPVSAVN